MSESSGGGGGGGGVVARMACWVAKPGAGIFLLGAALAFGVIGASERIGHAMRTMRQDNIIRVKGVAEVDVTSDRGAWWSGVSGKGATLAEADQARERAITRLRAYLVSAGFKDDELKTGSLSISRIYKRDDKGNTTNELVSFVLSQSIGVFSNDLERIRRTANEVTAALVKDGIEVESETPSFTVSTIEQAKLDLLERATANAYERAQTLARGSSSRVGGLVSASQGVYQIVARGSTASSDYGEFDTRSIDKTARVVVTLEYSVE